MGTRQLDKALERHKQYHIPRTAFDVYCVAKHGSDYQPKYLQKIGDICHDGYGESLCSDYCRQCTKPCPIPFCNTEDDPYFKDYWDE